MYMYVCMYVHVHPSQSIATYMYCTCTFTEALTFAVPMHLQTKVCVPQNFLQLHNNVGYSKFYM